jgi:hypothetical protein
MWALDPNPGGLPTLGNSSFSLTVASSGPAGSAAGFYVASLAKLDPPALVAGVSVHVDLSQSILLSVHLGSIPLPIPNDAVLVGGRVFFQSFHVDAGAPFAIAATSGIEATVL